MVAKIIKDICKGLSLIHKQNYIHRDLKPENILLNFATTSSGEKELTAKIADFGLTAEVEANVFTGQGKINSITGTMLFMAPEQATGQSYGKRVDMWAIGIIMYQLLTGRHPFHISGDDEKTYTYRISKENIELVLQQNICKYDLSSQATNLIFKLLARGISDRYRVDQVLAHPFITRN